MKTSDLSKFRLRTRITLPNGKTRAFSSGLYVSRDTAIGYLLAEAILQGHHVLSSAVLLQGNTEVPLTQDEIEAADTVGITLTPA